MYIILKTIDALLKFFQDLGVRFSVSRNILSCQIVRDCIEYTGRATHKPDLIHDYCVQEDMNKSCAEAVNIASFNINVVLFHAHRYINVDVRTYPIIYHKCTVIISEKDFSFEDVFVCVRRQF